VFISAVSSSGPGLIGATKQDPEEGGRWYVEAGELPNADLSIAVIDEADKADKDTLNVLYNVMEDGRCTISKAARRTLTARVSLVILGNPKYQKVDLFSDIIDQITFDPALLNRGDLPILMIDRKDHDAEISKHILNANYYGECMVADKMDKLDDGQKAGVIPKVSPRLLKVWIAYAKNNIHPIMNTAAMAKIDSYYLKLRGDTKDAAKAPVTPRQEQGVIRLAEAAAKMRLSSEVTTKDADAAIEIFDHCIKAIAMDPKTGSVDMGRLGQGVSANKASMIAAIKDIVINEQGLSIKLLLEKLDSRGFKKEDEIRSVLKKMCESPATLYEPKFEHYRTV
jgi:replicative DNA helicase Mcm